ncbi:testicular haploid expressed gene protein [Xenopus laevis]|nr:testicular haploid expressed gene protein [Xenopus laevis]XP_018099177.1 testicular haploid expressed gene protein [Xenopus laevis]XP_041435872.1 testicular haploid expressed gene protein [Xenopus laevis]
MSLASYSASRKNHLDSLARPKVNFNKQQDRPSVYWVDKIPSVSTCGTSQRQEDLAKPKKVITINEDRPSPIWPVSSSALSAVPSGRVQNLAQPKKTSQEWKEDRPAYSTVSEGAKKASASPRTTQLAKPKHRATCSLPGTPNSHQESGKESARSIKSAPTARTEALAVPKVEHPEYQHDLSVVRPVPSSALHTQATDRVCQLAKPSPRKIVSDVHDPYRISPAAKHAEASPRIQELCTPPARRQRAKKM